MMHRKKWKIVLLLGLAIYVTQIPVLTFAQAVPSSSLQALINKQHPLKPLNYTPNDLVVPQASLATWPSDPEMRLRTPAANALSDMFRAASNQNIQLVLASGYRSYTDQKALYQQLIAQQRQTIINEVAASGTSEHQAGLAADIILSPVLCAAQGCFTTTKAASWLETNSYHYGFILRYPKYKEAVTGYIYEPWHFRYVGIPLASKLHNTNSTLEEYYMGIH